MAAPWLVNITDEADADLKRLRKVRRKAWQVADRLLDDLEQDPYALGDECDPPFIGVRRVHFWNDKYRLVWRIDDESSVVDVLGCDLKSKTFYRRMEERFLALAEKLN